MKVILYDQSGKCGELKKGDDGTIIWRYTGDDDQIPEVLTRLNNEANIGLRPYDESTGLLSTEEEPEPGKRLEDVAYELKSFPTIWDIEIVSNG